MVCSENDTSINVTIPVVMIPQSAGKKLKNVLDHGASGKLFINYPPFSCKMHRDFFLFTSLSMSYLVISYLDN